MEWSVFKPFKGPGTAQWKQATELGQRVPTKGSPMLNSVGARNNTFRAFSLGKYVMASSEHNVGEGIRLIRHVDNLTMSPGLHTVEVDNTHKALSQSGNIPGWYIPEAPMGESNATEVPLAEMEKIFAFLERTKKLDSHVSTTAVRGKNSGYPLCLPGSHPFRDLALISNCALAWGHIHDHAAVRAALNAAFEPRMGIRGTFLSGFSRYRFSKKGFNHYTITFSGPRIDFKGNGFACPKRLVMGSESGVTTAESLVLVDLHPLVSSLWCFKAYDDIVVHSIVLYFRSRGHDVLSEDISGFDSSTSLNTMMNVASVIKKYLDKYNLYEAHIEQFTAPIYVGPLYKGDRAFLLSKKGMIVSGSKTTAFDGTFINFCRTIICMARTMGWTVDVTITKLEAMEWGCLVKGDDTVLFPPKDGFSKERYLACSKEELGYTTDLLPDAVLLMNYYPGEPLKRAHGLLGRALMQTWFRENPPVGPATEAFGMLNRFARCRPHPNFSEVWDGVVSTDSFKQLMGKPMTFSNFSSLVLSSSFQTAFNEEVTGSVVGERWLSDFKMSLARGDEHMLDSLDPMFDAFLAGVKDGSRIKFDKRFDDWRFGLRLAVNIYDALFDAEGDSKPTAEALAHSGLAADIRGLVSKGWIDGKTLLLRSGN